MALFYLANYFAHCLTVKTLPGDSAFASLCGIVIALFFPTSGVVRAVNAIIRNARFGAKDEIHGAARAGALCMIMRTRFWAPQDGDVIRDLRTTSSQRNWPEPCKASPSTFKCPD
jgi:hypothetical protein